LAPRTSSRSRSSSAASFIVPTWQPIRPGLSAVRVEKAANADASIAAKLPKSGDAGGLALLIGTALRSSCQATSCCSGGTKAATRLLRVNRRTQRRHLCLESRRSKEDPKGRSRSRPRTNHTSPPNTSKRPPGWPAQLSPTRTRKRSAKRKSKCRAMIGFLRQLRRAIVRSWAPDVLIAILAATLAWFITALLRAAIRSN
jgi:hypothetical protein